ncbi:MAG TPA: TIGR03668 family PPOX class F420-dependent oxidoreductase [Streptosporangiaceae bacterium]|nr:TIGR03668 family PPOX class F420-dependent oxidoreductase [Streptosporangiaceae bacterium]
MRLTAHQARELFGMARVATLATVSAAGQPHVVPVTFATDGDFVYTAVDAKPKSTRDLARLRNLRANTRVAVLADHYDDDWSALWWARADGEASIVEDLATVTGPVRLLAGRYRQYQDSPPEGPLVIVRVLRWTGWSAS